MICPVCGFENLTGAEVCDNCGADLSGTGIPQPTADVPRPAARRAPRRPRRATAAHRPPGRARRRRDRPDARGRGRLRARHQRRRPARRDLHRPRRRREDRRQAARLGPDRRPHDARPGRPPSRRPDRPGHQQDGGRRVPAHPDHPGRASRPASSPPGTSSTTSRRSWADRADRDPGRRPHLVDPSGRSRAWRRRRGPARPVARRAGRRAGRRGRGPRGSDRPRLRRGRRDRPSAHEAGRPVLAVGQHDDVELRRRALAAGASRVHPYRRVFEDGPRVIGAWLAEIARPPPPPTGPTEALESPA